MLILLSVLCVDLLVLNGLVLWAFIRHAPARAGRGCRAYNTATFLAAPVISTLVAMWVNTRAAGDAGREWLPALAALAWVAAFPAVLLVAGVVRNYLIYHEPREKR
jgi:hypothetical protein